MHKLLARQLKKLQLDDTSAPDAERWLQLLRQIEASYEAADQDRYTLERSLTISSEEMQVLYQRQKSSYEARLYAILQALPDILFLFDEDGRYIEIMSGDEQQLYRDKNKLIGKTLHEILPPEEAAFYFGILNEALETNQLVVVDYESTVQSRQQTFEGRAIPADYTVNGKRTVVFLATDITERRQSEIRGRLISTVFENSREGMVILDQDLKVVSVNEAFCKIADLDMQSALGQKPRFIDDLMATRTGTEILYSLHNTDYWMGEIVGKKQDGMSYPLWLTLNAVKDDRGQLTYYVHY